MQGRGAGIVMLGALALAACGDKLWTERFFTLPFEPSPHAEGGGFGTLPPAPQICRQAAECAGALTACEDAAYCGCGNFKSCVQGVCTQVAVEGCAGFGAFLPSVGVVPEKCQARASRLDERMRAGFTFAAIESVWACRTLTSLARSDGDLTGTVTQGGDFLKLSACPTGTTCTPAPFGFVLATHSERSPFVPGMSVRVRWSAERLAPDVPRCRERILITDAQSGDLLFASAEGIADPLEGTPFTITPVPLDCPFLTTTCDADAGLPPPFLPNAYALRFRNAESAAVTVMPGHDGTLLDVPRPIPDNDGGVGGVSSAITVRTLRAFQRSSCQDDLGFAWVAVRR